MFHMKPGDKLMSKKQGLINLVGGALLIILIFSIKDKMPFKTSYYGGNIEANQLQEVLVPLSNQTQYRKYMDGVIQYVEGTLTYFDYFGTEKWKVFLGLEDAIIKTNQESVYVYDGIRNQVIKFNSTGKIMYRYTLEGKMKSIYTENQEDVVLIYEVFENKSKAVIVLDKNGRKKTEIQVSKGDMLNSALSVEQDSIVLGMLSTEGEELEAQLLFFDFKGNLVNSMSLGSDIIYKMHFDNEGKMIVIEDGKITAISKEKVKWSVDIEFLRFIEEIDKGGVVVYGSKENNNNPIRRNKDILIVQNNGKMIERNNLKEEISGLDYNKGDILAYSKRSIYILSSKGDIVYQQLYNKDIEEAYLFENGHLIVITKENIYFAKLEKK